MTPPGGRVSLLLPFVPSRPEQAAPFAAFVQWRPVNALWHGQSFSGEQHQIVAGLCGLGIRVPLGIGVSVMPLRHPVQAVLEARGLAAASGHPVTAGFGPGPREFQAAVMGRPYADPLLACREYLTIVRGLLDGEEIEQHGEYFSFTGGIPQFPAPPVEAGLGVLRPGMARLAGEVADAVITWLAPPAYLEEVIIPELTEAAKSARRPTPRIISIVGTALTGEDRDVVDSLTAGSTHHLRAPHYRDMLDRAGVAGSADNPESAVTSLLSMGGLLAGDPQDIAAGIATYHRIGVDEVVLNSTGVALRHGPRAVLVDMEALFTGNGW